MHYTIVHEIPGRLRLNLLLPRKYPPDRVEIENNIMGLNGIAKVSFNEKTLNLLVKYDGTPYIRDAILNRVERLSYPLASCRHIHTTDLDKKKKKVFMAGCLLLFRPVLPLPIALFATLYGTMPFIKKGVNALFKRQLNVDVLDASALGTAMAIGDHRTAGVISFLLKVGDYLEEWTKERSRKALSGMFRITDGYAWVKKGDTECEVPITGIKENDMVVVRRGAMIPVDGIVAAGEAMVNQSSMTGESLPLAKKEGLTVYAGTVVEEGMLVIKASRVGDETRVAKIVKVIQESEGLKADVQSHAEKLADRIVPYTFLASGLTYVLTGNPMRAASLLLVDYSCAIKLSVPLTVMAGMMRLVKHGVLIKGGKFIEKLAEADVFVLDKTGTLTESTPKVAAVKSYNGYTREFILKHAACLEEHFPHPVATSVVKKAKDEGIVHKEEHAEVEYILAHGIASRLNGKRVLVGSRHFLEEDEGIDTRAADSAVTEFAKKGCSILYVAIGGELAGIIAIEDPVRENSGKFIRMLKEDNVQRIIMLTGDNEITAGNVARDLGIKEYVSGVFPETKTEIIKDLKKKGHKVAMVGDGINDSPALSYADVGISMKHGADIAKEACDILLLDGNPMAIIEARQLSRMVLNRIKRNFGYIVWINSALIGLGFLGAITPAVSALAHNAATVMVALNGIRPVGRGYRHSSGISGINRTAHGG